MELGSSVAAVVAPLAKGGQVEQAGRFRAAVKYVGGG